MDASEGFAPVAGRNAQVLILGSLPGRRSIEEAQYYAHPRNSFWPIMRQLLSIEGNYQQRCNALRSAGIGVWDVLHQSVRPGSLDADIEMTSAVANDFEQFLQMHSQVRCLAFNGKKAEALFRSLVLPSLEFSGGRERPKFLSLPSTSPAYAGMSPAEKQQIWCTALRPFLERAEKGDADEQ